MSLAKNIGAFLKDRFSLLLVFDGAVLNAYTLVLVLNLALGFALCALFALATSKFLPHAVH